MKLQMRITTVALLLAVMLAGCAGSPQALTSAVQSVGAQIAQSNPIAAAPARAAAAQAPTNQAASPDLAAFEGTLEQIYTQVNPSVVNINVVEGSTSSSQFQVNPNSPFGFNNPRSQVPQQALGSGFVWDTQGHIVTNNHVVSGASQIRVTFSDDSTYDAKLVGADPNADLAVIQVDAPASLLHPVQVGDSTQLKVGQLAIAIGNPYGLSGTMTTGIISGLSRSLPVGLDNPTSTGPTYSIPDIIQTDASINPGNSGGVLVDDQGRLIGVTAAIESTTGANSGIGYVIPSTIVQKVVPSLISNGKYDHPYLGVSGTSLTPDLATAMGLDANQKGALIMDVTSGGPAAKAGVKGSSKQVTLNGEQVPVGGDVIVAIDNQPIKSFEDLGSYLINNTKAGQTVTLTVLRNGQEQKLQATLGVLPGQ